jgi:hypothetical protein
VWFLLGRLLETGRDAVQGAAQACVRCPDLMPGETGVHVYRFALEGEKGCKPQHLGFDGEFGDTPFVAHSVRGTKRVQRRMVPL